MQVGPGTDPTLGFPRSHPQDYDWRFTGATSAALVRQAADETQAGACLVHLGTPSTFMAGVERHGDRCHVLVERNATMAVALAVQAPEPHEVVCADVATDGLPRLEAAAAILDPPWYPDDTLAFLRAAARVCGDGALLWLCQPTLATRPGVAAERARLCAELAGLGLVLEATHAGVVRYRMPHFEAMSLRLAGADLAVPCDWRIGDLLVLRMTGVPRMTPMPSFREAPWREVRFGPVRIKLRATDPDGDLTPLVPGDVLDTVSRRDPVRQRVGFWTSGNRVFGLADPERIGALVQRCHDDLGAIQFSLTRSLAHAHTLGVPASTARRLFDVLLVELQEHTAFEESA